MSGAPQELNLAHETPLLFRVVCVFVLCVCLCVLVCVCVCVCTACSCGPWQTFSLPHSTSRVNVPSAQASHQVLCSQLCLQGLEGRRWAGCNCRACMQGLGRIAGCSWPINSAFPVLSMGVEGANGGRTADAGGGAGCCAMSTAVCAVDWFPFPRVSRAGRQDLAYALWADSCGGGSAAMGFCGGARQAARQCRVCVQDAAVHGQLRR